MAPIITSKLTSFLAQHNRSKSLSLTARRLHVLILGLIPGAIGQRLAREGIDPPQCRGRDVLRAGVLHVPRGVRAHSRSGGFDDACVLMGTPPRTTHHRAPSIVLESDSSYSSIGSASSHGSSRDSASYTISSNLTTTRRRRSPQARRELAAAAALGKGLTSERANRRGGVWSGWGRVCLWRDWDESRSLFARAV
ncbi:hypothetical protein DFH08DRAFT_973221 [Mycena albidolilacea]|uniref:Uncharacterized protein n=1 Tax=Mycena albidolilacea TaxID=1033008 RepID=A0AAD6Z9T4_9AGAR|nr:hypothetical protein DFH08DRAFT_973221 [Mycena albidolilacea]